MKIFISYSTPDADAAHKLYLDLSEHHLTTWYDRQSLLPGQRWELEIERNLRSSDYVVLLLSSSAVSRRGYFHREMNLALRVLDEIPADKIFIIPARLDECRMPDTLRHIHCVNMFPSWAAGIAKILAATGVFESDRTVAAERPRTTLPTRAEAGVRHTDSYHARRTAAWELFNVLRRVILQALVTDLMLHQQHGLPAAAAKYLQRVLQDVSHLLTIVPEGSFLHGVGPLVTRFADIYSVWASAPVPSERERALKGMRHQQSRIARWLRGNQTITGPVEEQIVSRAIAHVHVVITQLANLLPACARALPPLPPMPSGA